MIRCWFLIDLTIKLMIIIKLLLDVSTLSSVIFKCYLKFKPSVQHGVQKRFLSYIWSLHGFENEVEALCLLVFCILLFEERNHF